MSLFLSKSVCEQEEKKEAGSEGKERDKEQMDEGRKKGRKKERKERKEEGKTRLIWRLLQFLSHCWDKITVEKCLGWRAPVGLGPGSCPSWRGASTVKLR